MTPELITAKAQQHYDEFVRHLETLVNIDRGTGYPPGIREAVRFLEPLMSDLGFENAIHESSKYGPALVSRRQGKGTARILLLAHTDTVWPEGTVKERPFRLEGSKAFGPGVCDCASGVLAAYYAVKTLLDGGFDQFGEIICCFNPDEELYAPFSRDLIRDLSKGCDAALVMEAPTFPDEFIDSRGGLMTYTIQVHGRSTHAGVSPEKGANANAELMHILAELQTLGQTDGVFPNIAVIEGGSRSNIVADSARAVVDFRVDHKEAVAAVESVIARVTNERMIDGTRAVITGGLEHPPFERLPGSAPFIDLVKQSGAEVGLTLKETFCGGTTDGCFPAGDGIITLDGLSPFGSLYHTPDEYLDLTTVVPRVSLITLIMYRICSDPKLWIQTG